MKVRLLQITLLLFSFLLSYASHAQQRCGTVEYMKQFENAKKKEAFEDWMKEKRAILPQKAMELLNNEEETTVYQIPVVVHVIHNGEAQGVGTNISDSQIQSQIEVLNEDYKRLNADSVNIPAEFKSLYSNIGFEFVLAKRDPDGHITNGITRVEGVKSSWDPYSSSDDMLLKSQDYWPSEDYLNIWIVQSLGIYLGYAQYPESSLIGLSPPYDAETDGVVIVYDAFGSIEKDPTANLQSRFNLGRTSTHEIGHFFGLRHIWGDGGCGVDDYVDDTPVAEDNYSGCPNLGASSTTCGSQDMFMNYMDYVDDDCMNLFTLGQKDRMVVVIENSPRRLSLTTSPALLAPCEDLALISFTAPENGICGSTIYPSVEVQNAGTCLIDSAKISLKIDNVEVASVLFELNLGAGENQEVLFDPVDLETYGSIMLTAEVIRINGAEDEYIVNNLVSKISIRPEPVTELHEDFSTANPLWSLRTSQEISQWDVENAIFYSTTNAAGVFNYYNNIGNEDSYVSPKLYVNAGRTLLFDVAYGYRNGFDDTLLLLASTDCGITFTDTLLMETGQALATAESPIAFYPSGAIDWKQHQIDLSPYADQEVVFSFTALSMGGNRIYLDNIEVVDETFSDIALVGGPQPLLVCDNASGIFVDNKGRQVVNSLLLTIENSQVSFQYDQLNILPGERKEILLPAQSSEQTFDITLSIADQDADMENNVLTQSMVLPSVQEDVPLRETFTSNSLPEEWAITGTYADQNQGWKVENNQLEWIASQSEAKGMKEVIILPSLNMLDLLSASLHFDLAYAYDGVHEELLRVKASTDCGQTYETLLEEGGESLATSLSTSETWKPSSEEDWIDMYVDLSVYAGLENVQLAIMLTSAQGGNVYIDNVELFASNDDDPLSIEENTLTVYPNPVEGNNIHFTVNLSEAQPAQLDIINSLGSRVLSYSIPKALNQTIDIPANSLENGMYFVRLVGNDQTLVQRFVITK